MRRTAQEAEQTKQQIIDAAIGTLAVKGYANTTLDEIAAAAGVTKGAIFWHFRNKADLYVQLCEREHVKLVAMRENAVAGGDSPLTKLRRLLLAVVDNFYDNEQFRNFIELTWYKSSVDLFEQAMTGKTGFVEHFLTLMEELLEGAREAGEVRPEIDARLSALHCSCLINGIYRLYLVAPSKARDKRDAQYVFLEYLDQLANTKTK